MADPVTPAGGVFISYRRQETAPYARLLREELGRHFGAEQVFMDVDSIEVGVDFAEAIQQAVAGCEVLLALVGSQWLTVTDANGQRRLEDPDDTVRLEIEAALARNIRVIPVLVDNTSMPQRQQLPESLAPLSRRNALELSYNRYGYDLERLLEAVGRVLGQRSTPVATSPIPKPAAVPAAAGAKGAGPPSVVKLVSQAKAAHRRKRFQKAFSLFDEALQLAPDNSNALMNRGVTYIDVGRNEEALGDLDRALELAPDNPDALMNRGVAYLNLRRNEEALRDLNRALELAPDTPFALSRRGGVYLNLGRYEEALRDLDRALELAPDDPWALSHSGAAYIDLGRNEEALRDLDRAVQLAPDDPYALTGRGVAYLNLGRNEEALGDLNRALELAPDNPDALMNRGATYMNLGRNKEALRDLDRALQLAPDTPYALSRRGATYIDLGRNKEALRDLDRALQLTPDDPWTLEQRRRLP